MKHSIYVALLAFAIGFYVGKPAEVVIKTESLKDCTVLQTVYSSDPQPAVLVPPTSPTPVPTSTPEVSPSPTPTEQAQQLDQDPDALQGSTFDEDEWVKNVVKELTVLLGKYDFSDGRKVTMTSQQYGASEKLRAALAAANLKISEEGPMKIGEYIYYFVVSRND